MHRPMAGLTTKESPGPIRADEVIAEFRQTMNSGRHLTVE